MLPLFRNYGQTNKKCIEIVYCRSLNLCSSLYFFFLSNLGPESYYPLGSVEVSDNRLFGMFHAQTPQHNKDVILSSMQKEDGVVRIVFATVALGMGVNFVGLNRVIHYGAPSSIEDYFQECGRAGRSGDQAKSTIYWKASDAPLKRTHQIPELLRFVQSLNLCSSLYFFLSNLGPESYYPLGSVEVSDNRLFGMFHAQTPQHNKDVILSSMQKEDGVVRIVFATVALGMGVNFVGLNRVIHYGAPSSIEDYFQECGRAGRSGDQAKSTIYWKASDAPLKRTHQIPELLRFVQYVII